MTVDEVIDAKNRHIDDLTKQVQMLQTALKAIADATESADRIIDMQKQHIALLNRQTGLLKLRVEQEQKLAEQAKHMDALKMQRCFICGMIYGVQLR